MIEAFCPSFNRACQMDGLLRSFQVNAPSLFAHLSFTILWKAHPTFLAGYDRARELWKGYHNVVWIEEKEKENGSVRPFTDWLKAAARKNGLVCLLTDDCLCYRRSGLSVETVAHFLNNPQVWTFSFRLGQNTVLHDYINNGRMAPLEIVAREKGIGGDDDHYIAWNWVKRYWAENYGYYFGWDGMVYRATDLVTIMAPLNFPHIRYVERVMIDERAKAEHRPLMISPEQSFVFCQQVNATHSDWSCGNIHRMSLGELERRFVAGARINVDKMIFPNISSAHFEVPYAFE